MRRLALILAVLAAVAGLPSAAQAARVVLTGTAGPAAEVFPRYRAAPGERNKLHVTFGRHGALEFADRGVARVRVARSIRSTCRPVGRRTVSCRQSFFAD